jgi:plasmid stability protein
MTLILELPDNKEAALKARAQAQGVSAEQYAETVLNRDLEEAPAGSAAAAPRRHISEVIREIWSDLPADARALLPADGASQVDHYVYGVPKRDQ